MTGAELKRLRERLKLTQAELAAWMGTTTATISRWESGDRTISELVSRYLKLLVETRKGKRTGGR
jgi:DNA-binding transcriptional regulator YiaG